MTACESGSDFQWKPDFILWFFRTALTRPSQISFNLLPTRKDSLSRAPTGLLVSSGFSGLAVAGYAVNVIDLAPNFSGLVMGFANSISTLTGKCEEGTMLCFVLC